MDGSFRVFWKLWDGLWKYWANLNNKKQSCSLSYEKKKMTPLLRAMKDESGSLNTPLNIYIKCSTN